MTKQNCTIQQWGIMKDPRHNDPYTAPELIPSVMFGKCYGHTKIAEGNRVITSRIVNIDLDNETIETVNTVYHLGTKSQDYELFLNGYNSEV